MEELECLEPGFLTPSLYYLYVAFLMRHRDHDLPFNTQKEVMYILRKLEKIGRMTPGLLLPSCWGKTYLLLWSWLSKEYGIW
jgi:hypothetical protein